jgi:hypothetical protein
MAGMAQRDVEGLLRWSLACMSLAAAVIHASVAADHRGFPAHVAFFLVVAAVQSGLAAAVLRRPSGRWLAAIAAANGAVIAVWVVSRTVGLPVEGASAAESIGFKDGICVLLEVGICAGAGLLGALPEAARRVALATGPLAATVIAVVVWGLGASGLLTRHSHDGHAHLNGGDIQAVADHHGGAAPGGRPDHDDGHHDRAPASLALPPGDHPAHVWGLHLPPLKTAGGRPSPAPAAHHGHGAPALAAGSSPVHRHAAGHAAADPRHHDGSHHDPVAPGAAAVDGHDHGAAHDQGAAPEGGHAHDPGPEERPDGERRDPGEDRPGVGRLIDDVARLVERR